MRYNALTANTSPNIGEFIGREVIKGQGGGQLREFMMVQNYCYNRQRDNQMSFSILFPTNEYTTSNKSPEEIQKLTLPAQYTLQQVLAHLMTKGVPAQMPFFFSNFHQAYKGVLNFVYERAPQQQSENQMLIAESLMLIVEGRGEQATNKELSLIFDTCLQCLNNLQSPSNEPMGKVIAAVLSRHTSAKELLKRMEQKAMQLGKANQPLLSRIAGCRLASLVAAQGTRSLRVELVEVLKRVAGESEVEARKVWLTQIFPRLLQHLDLEFIQLHFQERIYETVWDQNEEVSRLALQAILRNATRFSPEEQASRIVKLFIDSLTARSEKTAGIATEVMGEVYQKLQGVILQNEANCIRFWKSLVELSQTRSQKLLNNMVYNLYGVLALASPYHRVDPLCDVYLSLFYSPLPDKRLLASYFHKMALLFPNKGQQLREVVGWMLGEVLSGEQLADDAFRIINIILSHTHQCASVFLEEQGEGEVEDGVPAPRYFEQKLCQNLAKYLTLLMGKKVSSWISGFFTMLSNCAEHFSPSFLEQSLLPKLYTCLRGKAPSSQLLTETLVRLSSRDCNPLLINTYVSKVTNELARSSRSYQRQTALLFYYYCSFHLSMEVFREYKLGEKYLTLNNDKVFKVRASFLIHLPRIHYFLNKEERLQYGIIVARMTKEQDPELFKIVKQTEFNQLQSQSKRIQAGSALLREREKQRVALSNLRRQQAYMGRSNKELRKEDILKKRVDSTKTKNKTLLKEVPKKKLTPLLLKTNSNFLLRRRA